MREKTIDQLKLIARLGIKTKLNLNTFRKTLYLILIFNVDETLYTFASKPSFTSFTWK